MTPQLLVLGEMLGTLSARTPGRLHAGQSFQLSYAGAEGNVGIVAARQGTTVGWIGRLGDDPLGHLIRTGMLSEGIDLDGLVMDASSYTAMLMKSTRTSDTITVSYFRQNAAGSRICPEDISKDMIGAAAVLHISGITPALSETARQAVHVAIKYARDTSTLISFDVNYRRTLWKPEDASEHLRPIAQQADIVFASPDELLLVASTPQELIASGVSEVVIKDGARGAHAHTAQGPISISAHPVTLVDPVGAGDAFVGGYLSARISGKDTGRSLERAIATGAFAVSTLGDWEGAPTMHELTLLNSDDVVR